MSRDTNGRCCRGRARTLADTRVLAVVMETNGSGMRYGVGDDELLTIMNGYGFSAYSYQPFERMPQRPGRSRWQHDLRARSDRRRCAAAQRPTLPTRQRRDLT